LHNLLLKASFHSLTQWVALGLFVTTTDLRSYPTNRESLSYDCSFESECRWASIGNTADHWRVAHGEPEKLLWLAATGTMELPKEPYVLIELRGDPADALMTDEIECKTGEADLAFTYWSIGNADLEICLTDVEGVPFNCTGMLSAAVMPGKVSMRIPEVQKPYRVMSLSSYTGLLPIHANHKGLEIDHSTVRVEVAPLTTTTRATFKVQNFRKVTSSTFTSTEVPFDLMIYGNRTRPLFDRRTGSIIDESTKLLCDFNSDFACRWGADSGKWAIVEQGAIPSLEESVEDTSLLPSYPAALVLQGTSVLASDPIRCQTGPGKVLFRYWSNGDVKLQVCLFGHGDHLAECINENANARMDNRLVVFDLTDSVKEPFTLNIVAHWREGVKNRYLVIDEIAYIGECSTREGSSRFLPSTTASNGVDARPMIIPETRGLKPYLTTTQYYLRKTKIFIKKCLEFHSARWILEPLTTTQEPPAEDYCRTLNCNFNGTMWKLEIHGLYGVKVTATRSIHRRIFAAANGQFVSTVLGSGDIAILESPKFSATPSLNVLLFQYYRPSHSTTIRLCLGSSYTSTFRTTAAFMRCPSILRSITTKNWLRWNTVHVQLPPGTTHFFLVAHNHDQSASNAAVAVDNIRVAICGQKDLSSGIGDYDEEIQPFVDRLLNVARDL
uniref:MAM domain-containing protein n=1 Tax=Nippostrongylus brasiliensis TaxID=27835 RepID=A0A0N4XCM4_NIPBR